jgi:hypothetical protein
MEYFLTIKVDGIKVKDREIYNDYAAALSACFAYCTLKPGKAILKFTTETINGVFAKSYAGMDRPERIDIKDEKDKYRYAAAAKLTNSFEYDADLFFIIEGEAGIADQKRYMDDE